MLQNLHTQTVPSDQSGTFNISIFEVVNQKVNLTKICQSFDKDIRKWTKQEGVKALISALEEAEPNVAHLEIINGVGTFGTREIAIELTRWISPKFAVWANKQIDTLLQTGRVELATTPSYQLDNPIERAKAWIMEQEEAQKVKLELQEAQPAIEFTKAVASTEDSIPLGSFSRLMGIGRNTFIAKLKELSILMDNRLPYQKYIEQGLFKVIEVVKTDKNERTRVFPTTMVTGKGQTYLQNRLSGNLINVTFDY